MYIIEFNKTAQKDLKKLSITPYYEKVKKIIEELKQHPKIGTGKPEQLKHKYSGFWSRELTQKDRIVYKIDEENGIVVVHQLLGHYFDK